MSFLSPSLAVLFAFVLHVVRGECDGAGCVPADSAEVLLSTKARFQGERLKLSEESEHTAVLPRLAEYTKTTGLPNLLALQNSVERAVNESLNNHEALNKTGQERTYDPNTTEVSAVKTIRDYLVNVIDATKDAHANAQQMLNMYAEQVQKDNADGKLLLDNIAELLTTRDNLRDTHSQCRTVEASLKSNKTTHCSNYNNGIKGALDPSLDMIVKLWPTRSSHTQTQKDELQSAIIAAGEWMTGKDGLPRGQICQDGSNCVAAEESSLIVSAKACESTEEERKTKRGECNSDQARFEAADCEWHATNDKDCAFYTRNIDRAIANFRKIEDIQTEGMATRQAEHVAAKRVDCYLNVLLADQVDKTEMMSQCKNAVYSVDHLRIVVPSIPDKYECSLRGETDMQTCGEDWLQAEYKSKRWYQDGAPTEACTPCPTPVPTPAPTSHEQACSARYWRLTVTKGGTSGSTNIGDKQGHYCFGGYGPYGFAIYDTTSNRIMPSAVDCTECKDSYGNGDGTLLSSFTTGKHWCVWSPHGNGRSVLLITFGADVTPNEYRFDCGGASNCAASWIIEASLDGSTWRQVDAQTDRPPRKVQAYALNNGACEKKAAGAAGANVALYKPVTASSHHSGKEVTQRATDGKMCNDPNKCGGSIAHTNYDQNAWIQVDLEDSYVLADVVVGNGWSYCCQNRINPFLVRLHDANGYLVWSTGSLTMAINEECGKDFCGEAKRIPVTYSGAVRYVKVQLDNHQNYLHVAEIEAHKKVGS